MRTSFNNHTTTPTTPTTPTPTTPSTVILDVTGLNIPSNGVADIMPNSFRIRDNNGNSITFPLNVGLRGLPTNGDVICCKNYQVYEKIGITSQESILMIDLTGLS